jgi:hypothetical protein
MAHYASNFARNEIDFAALLLLTDSDLQALVRRDARAATRNAADT